jgi:hypothetical protein
MQRPLFALAQSLGPVGMDGSSFMQIDQRFIDKDAATPCNLEGQKKRRAIINLLPSINGLGAQGD